MSCHFIEKICSSESFRYDKNGQYPWVEGNYRGDAANPFAFTSDMVIDDVTRINTDEGGNLIIISFFDKCKFNRQSSVTEGN